MKRIRLSRSFDHVRSHSCGMMRAHGALRPKRSVNSLACASLLLSCLGSALGASSQTQLSLVLPWSDTPDSQRVPAAVFTAPGGGAQTLVSVAGMTQTSWELAGTTVAVDSSSTHVTVSRQWSTQLPLGGSLPSPVAVAGDLAVLELDGRVFGVHPHNGSLAWNATSPCSLGKPRPVDARTAFDAVYLICHELSGDSTLIALHPENGTTAWAIASSSVASALARVRAAAATDGVLVYADTGSNITALAAADGALLWQVDVAPLALPLGEPGAEQGTAVTNLDIVGDVLLVREYAAGLDFSSGPFSYLALQLNASGPPSLLWSSPFPAQRDRLPAGLSEASPAVPPALSESDDLFYYWSSTNPPTASPPPPPADMLPTWTPDAVDASAVTAAAASPAPEASQDPRRRVLSVDGLAVSPAAAFPPSSAPPANSSAAAAAASSAAEAQAAAEAVLSQAVAPETQGVGVVAPEGVMSAPVLKARSLSTGEEVWAVELQPVSPPTATTGTVAVVTPAGLQVLDADGGALLWSVDQRPLGIYPYTPTLLGAGEAVAVRNCLDTLASNSLCIYAQATEEGAGALNASPPPPSSGAAVAVGGWPLLSQVAGPALAVRVMVLAAAAAALLLLF